MQDLLKTDCKPNMVGHKIIRFADVNHVKSISLKSDNKRVITFKEGLRFFDIESSTISLNSQVEDATYNITIEIEFNGVQNKYDSVLNRMIRHKYICMLVDNNDTIWGAGIIEEPLNFSFERIGDADSAGRCNYMLRFYRKSTVAVYELEA
jgi:hypothetical protein